MIQPGIFVQGQSTVHFSRFESEKMYRLIDSGKNTRLDHFTGID